MRAQALDEQGIIACIAADPLRMRALVALRRLNLPDAWLAAGFVRNLIWARVYDTRAPLNDIDVIYYCPQDLSPARDAALQAQLCVWEPDLPWSVKNQARMHIKNGDPAYASSHDAMAHWPEKQTAIAVQLSASGALLLNHVFALALQSCGTLDHNPARALEIFQTRVASKGWLNTWPALTLNTYASTTE